ncbi:YGR287C-like protein [Dactylonectria macrodidyma]|uniref:YGR287C-like protein n=1 Tax=Dactylonectria macrodidyma TaxID=307937 RepID=A0A9P9E9Y9_9HYPO|nr:YGR287C-like protein [Dactylonectria macrodidyma]
MLDLVINHTSDRHAWFKESRSSRTNAKSDWYIWRSGRLCPKTRARLPPNNWRSCFGTGSAWQWDEVREEYYLHLYTKEMPDLNWESEEGRKAIYESAMETWLRKGVDGFRVDTVNLYSKLPDLPDAPITDPTSEYQFDPTIYCNGPRAHEFIGEMNTILSKYNAITVGELPATPDPVKVLDFVRASRKQLSMVFQFDIVELDANVSDSFDITFPTYTLSHFKAAVAKTQRLIQGTDGWTTVFLESHDLASSVSRL